MPRHTTNPFGLSSRITNINKFQPRANPFGNLGGAPDTGDSIFNLRFPWEINQLGDEFDDRGKRLRPASFDELRERQGQNLFQNFGAIARGEEGFTRRVDPVTGQPIEKRRGQRDVSVGGTFNAYQRIPSFNIDATKVDVSGAQRANSQAFSAARQRFMTGAIGTFGPRLGARAGQAGQTAVNQFAAPLFAEQAGANASLIANAAFTDRASKQAADIFNVNTRKFGVTGQERMLNAFRSEAGQRAGIEIGRGGLELRREDSIIGKEAGDANRTLESQRIDIMGWDAWARDERARFSNFLQQLRDEFEREKEANKGGFSVGDIFKIGARAVAAYFTGGVSEAAYQGGNAASGGFGRSGSGPLYNPLQPPG